MKLKKREIGTKTWQDYETPKSWDVKTIADTETPLDTKVACANCGKETPFGETFMSRSIADARGVAMAVCEECHKVEMRKRADAGEL